MEQLDDRLGLETKDVEVQVRFITKLALDLPDTQFAVPDRLARYGLSEIINHLLQHQSPPLIFQPVEPVPLLYILSFLSLDDNHCCVASERDRPALRLFDQWTVSSY